MNFTKDIEESLRGFGASFSGFSNLDGLLPEALSSLNYGITIGVRLSDFIIDQIENSPTYTYFHHYRTVNAFLDHLALRCTLLIQEQGYLAMPIAASQTVNDIKEKYSGVFQHKTAAVHAGLGFIGKSGLFISNEYGPRVRLATILTNVPFEVKNKKIENGCGSCSLCSERCPALAITGNAWREGCQTSHLVDVKACSDYMSSKFKNIGRGSVCGVCIKVCPKRKS